MLTGFFEESSGIIGLLGYGVNVGVPGQSITEGETRYLALFTCLS